MTDKELDRAAEHETSWLKYYGFREDRTAENYEDENFYDRVQSIGYTKTIIELPRRCAGMYITSNKPVLESTVDELMPITEPRDHEKNIYTPLEYVMALKHGRNQEFINILKEIP